MRELETELGGTPIKLKADFAAALSIAEKVGDPLMIAREAMLEALMLEQKLTYNPKWKFTVKNVPLIIYIGMERNASSTKIEDVQNLVFEGGFQQAREVALEYLALIIGPTPEQSLESTEESDGSGE